VWYVGAVMGIGPNLSYIMHALAFLLQMKNMCEGTLKTECCDGCEGLLFF
jgi:hypothetical protein